MLGEGIAAFGTPPHTHHTSLIRRGVAGNHGLQRVGLSPAERHKVRPGRPYGHCC